MRVTRFKWNPEGRREIRSAMQRIKARCSEIFHYKSEADAQLVDFVALPAVALHWDTENPLWCQVIGAPGSGKTAHISLFESWAKARFVSRLTKNSLISGFRPEGDLDADPSFIKDLDGKLFVVKDFTCILQGPREERDSVIGQLRDIFDGSASRVFGNVGFKEYKSRFNLLLAVTHAIDGFHGVNSQLGERFISRREFARDRLQITEAAFNNILEGRRHSKFDALKMEFMEFVERLPNIPVNAIVWPDEMRQRVIHGADLIASCRSHVIREHNGRSIATRPAPEVGSRLVTQIVQSIAGFCILNGTKTVDDVAWHFGGARVLRDTLPTAVAWTLSCINYVHDMNVKHGMKPLFTVKDLLPITRIGWRTTDQIVTDLHHNGILRATYVGATGRRVPMYCLTEQSKEVINLTRLFDGYTDDEVDLDTLPQRIRACERKEHARKNVGKKLKRKEDAQ